VLRQICLWVQVFSDDEDEELDTTAVQHAAGKDVQGIPWERLHFSRDQYRVRHLVSGHFATQMPAAILQSGAADQTETITPGIRAPGDPSVQ